MDVDRAGHVVDRLAILHALHQRLDEHRGVRPHDVRAKQQAAVRVGDQLDEAVGVVHGPTVGGVSVPSERRHVRVPLLHGIAFGESDGCHLRGAENRVGDAVVINRQLVAAYEMPRDGPGLGVGNVFERVAGGQVAECKNAGNIGFHAGVGQYPSAGVHLDAGGGNVQGIRIRPSPAGDEHGINPDRAGCAVHLGLRGDAAILRVEAANPGVQQDVETPLIDAGECLRDGVVLALDERSAVVGDGDLCSQRAEEMRHLRTDVSTADDQQRVRLRLEVHDGVRRMIRDVFQPWNIRHHRPRPGTEHNAISGDAVSARLQHMRCHEPSRGVVHRHVRLRPAVLRPRLGNGIDFLPHAAHEPPPIHAFQGVAQPQMRAMPRHFGYFRRIQQHLGGDAAAVQTRAAKLVRLYDRQPPRIHFRHGNHVAGTRANDDQVIFFCVHGATPQLFCMMDTSRITILGLLIFLSIR